MYGLGAQRTGGNKQREAVDAMGAEEVAKEVNSGNTNV